MTGIKNQRFYRTIRASRLSVTYRSRPAAAPARYLLQVQSIAPRLVAECEKRRDRHEFPRKQNEEAVKLAQVGVGAKISLPVAQHGPMGASG